MEEYKRTARDFVEDALTNLRTDKEIIIIAQNTHWKTKLQEVKEVISYFSGKVSKKLIRF